MHYPRKAFSKNGKDTIVPKKAGAVIGQRDGLSKGDVAALRKMYPRLHWPAADEAETPADEVATPVNAGGAGSAGVAPLVTGQLVIPGATPRLHRATGDGRAQR